MNKGNNLIGTASNIILLLSRCGMIQSNAIPDTREFAKVDNKQYVSHTEQLHSLMRVILSQNSTCQEVTVVQQLTTPTIAVVHVCIPTNQGWRRRWRWWGFTPPLFYWDFRPKLKPYKCNIINHTYFSTCRDS